MHVVYHIHSSAVLFLCINIPTYIIISAKVDTYNYCFCCFYYYCYCHDVCFIISIRRYRSGRRVICAWKPAEHSTGAEVWACRNILYYNSYHRYRRFYYWTIIRTTCFIDSMALLCRLQDGLNAKWHTKVRRPICHDGWAGAPRVYGYYNILYYIRVQNNIIIYDVPHLCIYRIIIYIWYDTLRGSTVDFQRLFFRFFFSRAAYI